MIISSTNYRGWVTVRATWTGKHTGGFNGVPPTGKTIAFKFMDIMHVVNDQLSAMFNI